jgi:prolipoprotein diacylglyceryl transferase
VTGVLASLPASPGKFLLDAGPFHVRWYGFLIAVGVMLAIYLARREMRRRGIDPELAYPIAAWTVPGGIIGARVYHVITDWERFSGDVGNVVKIWEGGLGMPGVIVGGAIGAAVGARRAGLPVLVMFDCVIPGVLAAQILGRWGNYFNQELFGGPTDLPWGLEVDERFRPDAFASSETFHPTFLYESLANGVVLLLLYWLIRGYWRRIEPGSIFAAYLVGYGFVRFWVEGLRVDPAHEFGGLRLNQWVFLVVFLLAAAFLVRAWRRMPPPEPPAAAPAARTERPGARGLKSGRGSRAGRRS